MNSESDQSNLLHQYAAFVGLCFVVGAVLSFVIASYLNRGSIQHFFSFSGPDGPLGYATSVNPDRFGVHTFGDFLLPRWQSELSSPWFIHDPAQGPLNNYLPFTMAVFWLYSHFSYWPSFVAYLLLPLLLLVVVIWKALSFQTVSEKVHFISTCVFLTFPFISLIDRGNIQIYLTSILVLSLFLYARKHETWAAFALGFAIALKGYPIFLIALWIKARRWKDVLVAGTTSVVLTVLPLLFYDGGVTRNLSRIVRNVRINEDLYAADSLAFNNSLRGCLLTLSRIKWLGLGDVFHSMYNNFTLVFVVLLVIVAATLMFLKVDQIEIVVISTVLMSIYVDFVGGYALSVYFLFFIAIAMMRSETPKWGMRLLMFCIAIQMMPRGFPLQFWSQNPANGEPTYSSLLGGLASFCSLLIVLSAVLVRHLQERNKGLPVLAAETSLH